jgi:hypothetical protein
MYSATFALTAILGIALTNLFLGFAFAVLIGRGPRSLSDVEDAITIRYFSPQLLFPFSRRTAKQPPVRPVAAPVAAFAPIAASPPVAASLPIATSLPVAASLACSDPAPSVSPRSAGDAPPAAMLQSIAIAGTTPRLVLPPKPVTRPPEDEAPDVVLGLQLEAWQASDPREETPCLSGFAVTLHNSNVDDHVRAALINAVHGKITSQLRKDRRVLRTAENHFLWFSADVHPDDGLLPVGRIRQMIDKTRFVHEGTPLAVEAHAVVVAVKRHETAADLIRRAQATLKFAQDKGGRSMCVDVGDGPAFVAPARLDIDESELVLA